ncbi:P-type DNA transfer ATPase VirB11 [Brucella sp. 6810]|uniref:P-type DNA transfer ATPase VirB11 n=2 Tax=Brucella TaxID=234 RepID=UPI00084FA3E1|nr:MULTISPECIES: P-type DNA transfer ATPase VirB11 [unclassified Brucella]OEI83080.1 P-type DNA transfer ATPase VirB11 [Brucella sp. B13-0095]QMV28424.1 P-type DNA transfer ATPase VirB11 [Brucella sp. BO3]QNQ64367.1 P-type DNA transfer ATPase VirB11 [Brucella sp. 6810]
MSNRNDFIVPDEGAVKRAASVNFHLEPLRPWLDDPQITEVCVNRPGEVFCERASAWEYYAVPNLDYEHLISLGTATARFVDQDISDSRPVLSAILPMGERIQIVRPPACEHGTISVTIRKPSFTRRTLEDYAQQGFFKHVKPICKSLTPFEQELLALKEAGDYMSFLRRAVQLERVIVVAGETGSGKTTLMKALMQEIPFDQRLITIEDVPELFLPDHPNHVHLFYPSEAKEEENAPVTAATLLRSCLRMKPTRILLAELRGGETYDFINVAASGHGGSITSCHAGSCELTFERLALMVLQNRQGRQLPYEIIRRLLYLVVDVVVHVHNDVHDGTGRHISEVWYDPNTKRALSLQHSEKTR